MTGRARRAASTALQPPGTPRREARAFPGERVFIARRERGQRAARGGERRLDGHVCLHQRDVQRRAGVHRLGGGEVERRGKRRRLEAAWHARRSASAARDAAAAAGVARTRRRRVCLARGLARRCDGGQASGEDGGDGLLAPAQRVRRRGDARFPDRYASSKAARAASKRPDATAAALVSARRIAAAQAPRVTDGEFERDAHKTPSNASERICVASPVSSPVRRSLKEATQPETLLASPPRIHAHSSTARGDAFARITAAATRARPAA